MPNATLELVHKPTNPAKVSPITVEGWIAGALQYMMDNPHEVFYFTSSGDTLVMCFRDGPGGPVEVMVTTVRETRTYNMGG